MISVNCPQCHVLVRMSPETADTNPVCPRCRTPLVATIPPPVAPEPPSALDFESEPDPYYRPTRRKSGPPILSLVAIAVLTLGCIGGVVFAIKTANDNQRKAETKATDKKVAARESAQDRDWDDSRIEPKHIAYLIIGLPIYFAPSLIALLRRHNNLAPIIVVNALLGCVFVGWVVALAWSLSDMRPMRTSRPV